MYIEKASQLKIGDNIITDSQSSCASGGHVGTIVRIDDNFIYTSLGKKFEKEYLTDIECSNYFIAHTIEQTFEEY